MLKKIRYQAGNSACNSGYWEAFYSTTDGNSLAFSVTCDFNGQQLYNYTETRFNDIATDEQCNVVYDNENIDPIEGTWGNIKEDFDYIDFCIYDDDETHASYSRVGFNATQGYMIGQSMEHHRLFQGDYSAQNPEGRYNSGNVLFFPRSHQEAVMFTWPGPQIRQNGQHAVTRQIQRRDLVGDRCEANRYIVKEPGYILESDSSASSNFVCLFGALIALLALL